ncbi:hypothetical protein F5Y15DRAFT_137207 [Xylariaceae sp. FL0016]|nr:hypothetical protein F5Y15DRAFT_137207 [Xylariaceae sp. FL0016]
MATRRPPNGSSTMPRASSADIEQVDAFARRLYRRARNAGPDFEDTAPVVRSLHTVLKHLKVEAEDPESLLNTDDNTVYARQLTPIVQDAEFALKQLDTVLEKYYASNDGGGNDGDGGRFMNDGDRGWTMENRERDRIAMIHNKLAEQKLNIDMFLDTIQLHNPAKARKMVDTTSASLDKIKDKVDAIASRICQRTDSGLGDSEEDLWEEFRDELEKEGFSKDVLRKNQDILRAYIRQVDEELAACGGDTPTVRGFLENYHPSSESTHQIVPYPVYPAPAELDSREIPNPNFDDARYPSTEMDRLQHDDYLVPANMHDSGTGLSCDHHSSDDDYEPATESMALISTRDLMAIDKKSADLAIAMDNMHLRDQNYPISGSSPGRYLPAALSQPQLLGSSPPTHTNALTQSSTALDQYQYDHDPLSRYTPSLPPPPLGGARSPPPVLHSNSISAPIAIDQSSSDLTLSRQVPLQRCPRLAPDSHGQEIPLEAKWTRIRRSLVSPEVLSQAGVRYEARPDFVAVLGVLTREDVAEFARRSEEVRKTRRQSMLNSAQRPSVLSSDKQEKVERKDYKPGDRYHPDKYRNWDVIEEQSRVSGSGHVVDAHGRKRADSTTWSNTSEIYDSSEDEACVASHDGRETFPPYPSSYPPSASASFPTIPHVPSPYHHNFSDSSKPNPNRMRADSGLADVGSNAGSASDDSEEKGTKVYPFIVPTPKEADNENRDRTSISSTTKPKPILKNKNDDPHVKFNPEPQVLGAGESPPRSLNRKDREKERDRERDRDPYRERERERDREKRYRSDKYLERERFPDRYPSERHRDRDRDRDRDRERERDSHRHYDSRGPRYHGGPSSRRGERDEYPASNNRRLRDERAAKKRSRGETLRAVGIGGAAASLLSVLTEAAAGL